MIKHLGVAVVLASSILNSTVHAEDRAQPPVGAQGQTQGQVPAFVKGDKVCFFGDSIFHGGKVHSDLLLFQATRHPDVPITVFNAGVAGDMTKEAIRRVAWDVQANEPTVTVVMFGMNDVGRWLFGEGKDASPAVVAQRKQMMDAHVANLNKIIADLKGMKSKVVLCTPTPFDQTTQRESANAKGVDDALGAVAENVTKVARSGGYGLVDFTGGMNRVMKEQQAKDPSFTMMDGARVHPDEAGHLLMMYLFLKAQNTSPIVSRVVLDAAGAKAVQVENAAVTKLTKQADGLAFQLIAKALPYPIAEKEKAVLDWVPFQEDLNQEVLQVRGLKEANYEVLIDGGSVGTWSAAELGKGINLAGNDKTPQYKQAAEMMKLNEQRRHRDNNTLRIFAALEHDVLRPKGVDPTDIAAVRAAMDEAIAEEAKTKSWRENYFINLSRVYYDQKPKQKQIEAELEKMSRRLFELAKPKPHQYEIRPTNSGAAN